MNPGAGTGPRWLDEFLATGLPALIALRRDIHAHPELSFAETRTAAKVLETLLAAGIDAELLPSGVGVVAEIGTGERIVGLRADIDALPVPEDSELAFASTVPGVSHACGHDVHLTCTLGAALALAGAPDLPGRVRFIFQPAEEVMRGAQSVVEAGAVEGLDRIFALHCDPRLAVGKIGLRTGAITSACDWMEIELTGPGGHTARPHLTADLVYALGLVITGLPGLLSRRMDPRNVPILVWGTVTAGVAANAIPRSGVLKGTLRMMERAGWDQAQTLVREIITEILAPTRVSAQINYSRGVPPVVNDPVSNAILHTAAERAVGVGAVTATEQSTGAEDFAVMLERAPGAMARLGVWDGTGPQVDLHSSKFRVDERAIAVGVRLMTNVALEALSG